MAGYKKHNVTKTQYYGSDVDSTGKAIAPPIAQNGKPESGINPGEIAINNASTDPCAFILDTEGKVVKIGGGGNLDLDLLDKRYLLKQTFDRAFTLHDKADGSLESIEALADFWTKFGVTSLGVGSSPGGGSGGASTFGELLNVGEWADKAYDYDIIAYKPANDTFWREKKLSDLVGLDETALANYLTTNKYTTQDWVQNQGYLTQHQSLEGYATQNWVNTQLSGYVTNSKLNDYVSLTTTQTISGIKTFSSLVTASVGLKVGKGILKWDDEHNSFYFTTEDGTTLASIYANGVTALGAGSVHGGGGASTFGELINVGDWADNTYDYDIITYKPANGDKWQLKKMSELVGLDESALAQYLSAHNYYHSGNINVMTTDTNQQVTGRKDFYNSIYLYNANAVNSQTSTANGTVMRNLIMTDSSLNNVFSDVKNPTILRGTQIKFQNVNGTDLININSSQTNFYSNVINRSGNFIESEGWFQNDYNGKGLYNSVGNAHFYYESTFGGFKSDKPLYATGKMQVGNDVVYHAGNANRSDVNWSTNRLATSGITLNNFSTNLVASEQWVRVFTSSGANNGSSINSVLLMIGREYRHEQEESYTFMVTVGYDGRASINQLSSSTGLQFIDKVRLLWKNGTGWYIDIHYTGTVGNGIYVSGSGCGVFSCSLNSTIPEGYTAKEFKVWQNSVSCSNALVVDSGIDTKLIFNNTDGEKYSTISFRENNVEYSYISVDGRDGSKFITIGGLPVKVDRLYLASTGSPYIDGGGSLLIPMVSTTGGEARGIWYRSTSTDNPTSSGIGAYYSNTNFSHLFMGWGASPWDSDTNFHVNSTEIQYKGNIVWHAGNMGAGSGLNADTLDGYHRYNLFGGGISDLLTNATNGSCYRSIVVNGDKDTYYPVVIAVNNNDNWIDNIITVSKTLGSQTPNWSGNHSNGTSSGIFRFHYRTNVWDGNGGLLNTVNRTMPYANWVGHLEFASSSSGKAVVWLRGGGAQYNIHCNNALSEANIYYSRTNIASDQYPAWVEPKASGNHGFYAAGASNPCFTSVNFDNDNYFIRQDGFTLDRFIASAASQTLTIYGGTDSNPTWNSGNPKIKFTNAELSQPVALVYTDYDSYRFPAGLRLSGNQDTEWFEAPHMYSRAFHTLSGNSWFSDVSGYASIKSAGNEICIGGGADMHVNYRAAEGGTPSTWWWEAGSANNFANFRIGRLYLHNGYLGAGNNNDRQILNLGSGNTLYLGGSAVDGNLYLERSSGWVLMADSNNNITTRNSLIIGDGNYSHIYMYYGGNKLIIDNHGNGNVSYSATGNGVYLGYYNTKYIDFLSGKAEMDSAGNLTTNGYVLGKGGVTALTTASSDKRLKDVKSYKFDSLSLIRKIGYTVAWKWNNYAKSVNEHFDDKIHYGHIANTFENDMELSAFVMKGLYKGTNLLGLNYDEIGKLNTGAICQLDEKQRKANMVTSMLLEIMANSNLNSRDRDTINKAMDLMKEVMT